MDAVGRSAAGTGEISVLQSETPEPATCSTVAEPLALVVALELERLGVGDVLVGLADDAHRLGERGLLPVALEQVADGVEAAPHGGEQRLVDGLDGIRRCGISPKLLAIIAAVRLTRLPQPATSSSLLRCTNSAQVKSASWFSGPAAQMK